MPDVNCGIQKGDLGREEWRGEGDRQAASCARRDAGMGKRGDDIQVAYWHGHPNLDTSNHTTASLHASPRMTTAMLRVYDDRRVQIQIRRCPHDASGSPSSSCRLRFSAFLDHTHSIALSKIFTIVTNSLSETLLSLDSEIVTINSFGRITTPRYRTIRSRGPPPWLQFFPRRA
jgi:hypothetical protein